jgi:hypothetical protein
LPESALSRFEGVYGSIKQEVLPLVLIIAVPKISILTR